MLDNVKTATAPALPCDISTIAQTVKTFYTFANTCGFQSLFVLISTLPSCFY
ncbi:rCG45881 [Rattus norvegicus]|uniref:RCG45881 n=1 Tax=Rattus norvegicus TaxID=10116 RepID=A6JUA7_RAT|nr:rCG45881 [Rattus norvegicus]